MRPLLILRPEPGAGHSAARAAQMGLEPVTAPLLTIRRIPWDPPDPSRYDSVLLTSAKAADAAGDGSAALLGLPCYTPGEATAASARAAGFRQVRSAGADGAAALDMLARDGHRTALHLCGREHLPLERAGIRVERRIVYAADAVPELPQAARAALAKGALALLHSPRSASIFASMVDQADLSRADIGIVAISRAAADAAGPGWQTTDIAPAPHDEALLELAAQLCQTAPPGAAGR